MLQAELHTVVILLQENKDISEGGYFLMPSRKYIFRIYRFHYCNPLLYLIFKVYQTELEKVPQFQGFDDFIFTFPISRGRVTSEEDESKTNAGELKVRVARLRHNLMT